MTINVNSIAEALKRVEVAMRAREANLNHADSRMGDGDTGSMLTRMSAAIAAVDFSTIVDVGQAFRQMARAGSVTTGSSLGTLIVVALMTTAKGTMGKTSITTQDLSELIGAAKAAMMARGKSEIGDKTIIDGLDYVERAIGDDSSNEPVADRVISASLAALDAYRDHTSRIGRARLLAERSIGLDDPGMLALASIVQAIAQPE